MSEERQTANCPFCLSPIDEGSSRVRCPRCGVSHHADCWQTNGKCSVYGCDGWAAWLESVNERIAPTIAASVEVTTPADRREAVQADAPSQKKERKVEHCIKCGRPISGRDVVCMGCRKRDLNRYFENCFGPSVIMLCGIGTFIVMVIRALV